MMRPLVVVARSSCDEAIQAVAAERIPDCFATLAMAELVAAGMGCRRRRLRCKREKGSAYSSLPRVIAMEASDLVRVHSMFSRR